MRAFVITGPNQGSVEQVERPEPGPGQAVIAVSRVGVCGTDLEFFRGTQPYLATGGAVYPLRIGHEWCGTVTRVGSDADAGLIGRRVTGDTMLGCQQCSLCRSGRQHVCLHRSEVGVLNGWHGALAEELLMPVTALHELPDSLSDGLGALVEPASLSLRCVDTAGLAQGDRLLVWGLGAVGLLAVGFAAAAGIEVHGVGRSRGSLDLATRLGAARVYRAATDEPVDPSGSTPRFRAAIAASPVAAVPSWCLDRLEPGGRLVLAGISGQPSPLEARDLVVGDVTVSGLLSGSPVFARTIERLAAGVMRADSLIGDVVELEELASVLSGQRGAAAGGPKLQVRLRG